MAVLGYKIKISMKKKFSWSIFKKSKIKKYYDVIEVSRVEKTCPFSCDTVYFAKESLITSFESKKEAESLLKDFDECNKNNSALPNAGFLY